jgi:hypothetical protein
MFGGTDAKDILFCEFSKSAALVFAQGSAPTYSREGIGLSSPYPDLGISPKRQGT